MTNEEPYHVFVDSLGDSAVVIGIRVWVRQRILEQMAYHGKRKYAWMNIRLNSISAGFGFCKIIKEAVISI